MQKCGGDVCSKIQIVSCIRPSLHSLQSLDVQGRQSRRLLQGSGRRVASLIVYYGKSVAHVDTKSRGTIATCIVNGDRGRAHISSRFPSVSEQWKALRWPPNKATVICVYTQSTTEENQKLTKTCCQRHSTSGVFTRGKQYLCKNLGVKRGEVFASRGRNFWSLRYRAIISHNECK